MKINLREMLGRLDLETDNIYDLRNHYDSSKLSDLTKNRLAEALNKKSSAEKINRILNENFAINVFPRDSEEYEKLEKVADYLTNYSPNNIYYRVEKTYFDFGQDWMWTTIIAYDKKGNSWQAIYPKVQEDILLANSDEELEEIAKKFLRESRLDKGFSESLTEASYGGAYDIEDDMYFTKEELVEFADEFIEKFSDWSEHRCDLEDLYMDNPKHLIVDIYDHDDDVTHRAEINIDMRKIRTPKSIYRYGDSLLKQWKDSYLEYHEYDESLNEEVEEELYKVVLKYGPTKLDFMTGLSEEDAEEIIDTYAGRWIDENGYDWDMEIEEDDEQYSESLKESIDISDYEELRYPLRDGDKYYQLYRKIENGKGVWAAAELDKYGSDVVGEPFKITYEQARGFEPIEDSSIRKLSRDLGKKLLPKRENLNEAYRPLAIGYMILKKEIPNHVNYAEFANYDEVVTAIPSEADVVVYPRGGKIGGTDIAYWQFDAIDSEGKKTKANFSTYIYSLKDFLNNDEMELKLISDFKLIDEYPYLIEVDDDIEESLKEDIEDEVDFYEDEYSTEVIEGAVFIEDGKEWAWVERVAGPIHLDFDNWAVWEAREFVSASDFIIKTNEDGTNETDIDAFEKAYYAAEKAYFVVDEDTGFIDWGPVETQTEAQDFLNNKVEDWENDEEYDESLKESKDLKEWWTVDLDYEDIGSYGYTYEADGEDVVDYLTEMLYENGEYPDFLEGKSDEEINAWLDDKENYPKFRDWVEENIDDLLKKYEYDVLEYFEDDATIKYEDEHEDDDWGYGSDNGSGMTDRDFL